MLVVDEDAVICDLAETYNIYNYREMPPKLVASLVCGLRGDSRIKMKINEQKCSSQIWLLATIVDKLTIISCQLAHSKKEPKFLTDILIGKDNQKEIETFEDGNAYEMARKKVLERVD